MTPVPDIAAVAGKLIMTDNIVERARVAFVLAASTFEYDVRLRELTDDETRGLLRAAIATLLEPSEAMIEAGVKCHDHYAGTGTVGALNARRNVRQILVAAIDTALTEGNDHG